jgi:DNA-binding FadR family transcriptional regulator
MKVSRTVLRESMKVLAAKGLVELRPKVGIRVRPRHEWNLLDPDMLAWQHAAGVDDSFVRNLCEVRLVAETAAAGLAALRATDEDLAHLRKCYQEMEASRRSDKAAYDAADLEFHGGIFAACHNDLLRQMGSTISTALRGTHKLTSHLSPEIGLALHKAVCDAICERDAPKARARMEQLVIQAARTLYQVFHPDSADSPAAWKDFILTRNSEETQNGR